MKSIIAFISFLSIVGSAFSEQSEMRNVDPFHKIVLATSGTLYIQQGETQSVELRGDPEDIERIATEVEGGQLRVKRKKTDFSFGKDHGKVDTYITTTDLSFLRLTGSGEVIGEKPFTCDKLKLGISGSGKIVLEVDARDLEMGISGSGKIALEVDARTVEMNVSGSGKIDISGASESVESKISGSGRIAAFNLETQNHEAKVSGSGRCEIQAESSIDAKVSGSGTIRYRGEASRVKTRVSGSGRIIKVK